jgi:hypothetical protein
MNTKNIFKTLIICIFFAGGLNLSAQIVTKKAVDNKGTINTLLDATTSVITSSGNGLTVDNTTPTNPKVELGGTLTKPTTIVTDGTNKLQVTGLDAGAATDEIITIVPATGQLRKLSASSASGTADNGLTKTGNNTQLGGLLTAATTITTDGTKTLAVAGLTAGDLATDNLVVSSAGGVLKSVAASTLLTSGETNFIVPAVPVAVYTVPNMPAIPSRVWVYRNGVKLINTIDYATAAGSLTLNATVAPLLVLGDNIEVQWVK